MSFSKYNMTTNSVDNPNYEDQIKEQLAFGDFILSGNNMNTNGTPKQYSTHQYTADFANYMQMKYQDRARSLSVSSSSQSGKDHNPALMKTKICDHWRRFGVCSYGDSCWYAHGESDLRKLPLKPGRFEEKPKENEFSLEPKLVAPKRASTNVKGLTVNIPHNTFNETNTSLPLSPAQERWVSMSGQNPLKSSDLEHEGNGKMMLENARGNYGREEEANDLEDLAAFLSYNAYLCPPAFGARMSAGATQPHRSYSRGTSQRAPQLPVAQNLHAGHARYFPDRHQTHPRSNSLMRSAREPQSLPASGSHPQFHQKLWNVAGELYQRQKEAHHDEREYQFMAKLAKAKDMAQLKGMFEQGLLTERQVPRELWNELISTTPIFPNQTQTTTADCSGCGGSTRGKGHTSLHSAFLQNARLPHHHTAHSVHHHNHNHHHQHHHAPTPNPFRRAPPREPLTAPPKMLESLLPPDENFSIWFDSKSAAKNTTTNSDSSTSLLTKMEVFRAEKCPITEEEISLASGKSSHTGRSSIESLSPMMDALGAEPKMTMFDFDSLKIAETLKTSTNKSPTFFSLDEKTPGYDKPVELCDFFTAGGSCPFGDGCHMSHSIPKELKR